MLGSNTPKSKHGYSTAANRCKFNTLTKLQHYQQCRRYRRNGITNQCIGLLACYRRLRDRKLLTSLKYDVNCRLQKAYCLHKSSEKLGFGVGVSFRVRVSCVSDALANMKNSTNALISNNSEKNSSRQQSHKFS